MLITYQLPPYKLNLPRRNIHQGQGIRLPVLQLVTMMMEMEMEIPNIVEQAIIHPSQAQEHLNSEQPHRETAYRWVVLGLIGLSLLLNGLMNNAITPLEHKMTIVYGVSETRVSLSVILSFVAFFLANFPANKIIDTKGLRVGLIIGNCLYFLGTFLYVLINVSYYFVILGTLCMGLGQPFLLNTPAKVAAFWFFPKNRALATAMMIGINLLGMGVGFLIPTLVVEEKSEGQEAQQQIKHLYLCYFIFAGTCLILSLLFMQPKPEIAPSEGATAYKTSSIRESLFQVKKDRNLWMFFAGYCLGYGTIIAFGANSNFIIKPYGYTDFEIAINGVLMMVAGTVGAVVFSIYIKKTNNYKRAVGVSSFGTACLLILLCAWLNTVNAKVLTSLLLTLLGFVLTPIIPICYDLGCELTFPMGEAQVIGFLNGGALFWAFLSSAFVTAVFGYGSQSSSMLIMGFLSFFVVISAALFYFVRVQLRRRTYELQQKLVPPPVKHQIEMTPVQEPARESQNQQAREGASEKPSNYGELVQEQEIYEQKGYEDML